jgi:hypothetical protein
MSDPDRTPQPPPPYDMGALNALAGVLSGGLVEYHPKAMNLEEACVFSEREPDVPAECGEVAVACWLLVGYGLAEPASDDEWRATLAAVKAEQIDF